MINEVNDKKLVDYKKKTSGLEGLTNKRIFHWFNFKII